MRKGSSARQMRLALVATEIPEEALLNAYQRCRLSISFADAMKDPMFKKCITNCVMANMVKGARR